MQIVKRKKDLYKADFEKVFGNMMVRITIEYGVDP